jgi:ATP synthase protein I
VWSGLDNASIMGVELMAGILIWAGVGHLLDRWLGTGPWLLGVGAIVGYAAGLYLVGLRAGKMEGAPHGGARGDDGSTTRGR